MKIKLSSNYKSCLVINDESLVKSIETMKRTWFEFCEAIAQKQFSYNQTEEALKAVFLKQFDQWFQGIGKQEMSISFFEYFKDKFVGRGTVIKPNEPDEKPQYDRFMPKSEYIKEDNRFSPSGVEWLYLAIGESEEMIKECAEKECRAKEDERFGFCGFTLRNDFAHLKVVDLTIANNMSYDDINDKLRKVEEDEYNRSLKIAKKHGLFFYKYIYKNNEIKQEIARRMLYTYAKMMSENIFVPIETDDKKLEYAPFQTLAMYFIREGFDGIVYSSTVCPKAKNIVLFDKEYAIPYGEVHYYSISSQEYDGKGI